MIRVAAGESVDTDRPAARDRQETTVEADDATIGEETVEPVSRDSVVVGHDGSGDAGTALATALSFAEDLHAPVVVVRAWSIATAPRPKDWTFGYVSSAAEMQQAVLDQLVNNTKQLVERFPHVTVTFRAVHASPARSLIEASAEARMLVVGTRGAGGFAEMVLGSVSDQVVRHAQCPVLVTRSNEN